ncbi:MAG: deoxyribonuclease IV [Bacillota bacterium]|nr:deoxyribonuclease IV [Bacillota bacterium]
MKLGCHVSISGGLSKAIKDALSVEANAVQFFSRNPRGGRAKALDFEDINKAKELITAHKIDPLIVHAPYTINLCAAKENLRQFAKEVVAEDLERADHFGCSYFVVHPGSHVNQGRERGKHLISEAINEVFAKYQGNTMLLLETMAGQGTEMGTTFAEMAEILERIEAKDRVGICIDTCHLFVGGFSVIRPEQFIDEIEASLPINKIKACHLNDTKMLEGSFKDRHAPLGQGEIGWQGIMDFITHPKLKHLPFILETPGELEHYGKEISEIRDRLS